MSDNNDAPHYGPDGRAFYGAVTVGERGQVVIPAQARREHGIEAGQKLLVLGSPDGLALMSADRLFSILGDSAGLLEHLKGALGDGGRDVGEDSADRN